MSDVTATGPEQQRLHAVLTSVLGNGFEPINDSSSPETIESWDSLNHLNLVMAIEQEFAVSLSADDALEMRNVGAIRTVLAKHGVRC